MNTRIRRIAMTLVAITAFAIVLSAPIRVW